MKELVKPNVTVEKEYDLSFYCETDCSGRCTFVTDPSSGTANKGCTGGARNNSIGNDDDLIF